MTARNAATKSRRRLRDLSGIGERIEADLHKLDVHTVERLAESDGDELYGRLCDLTGARQDPCVLDTFRCAVAQARDPELPAEQRSWWWWSRQRKSGRYKSLQSKTGRHKSGERKNSVAHQTL